MPVLVIGGLAVAAYVLLNKSTTPAPVLVTTTCATRNASANNIVAYATAAALGITAITKLIAALNSDDDSTVTAGGSNPASYINAKGIEEWSDHG